MSPAAKYTTQLQAGLGLVRETTRLLELWQPGMVGQDLLKAALASGTFSTMSARRLRNIIIEAFCPRYLVNGSEPAGLLKSLVGFLPKDELRSLFFLFTCRANRILGDFVRQVYWARYEAGAGAVSKDDARAFITSAISSGRTTSRWSEVNHHPHEPVPAGSVRGLWVARCNEGRGSANQHIQDHSTGRIDFGA